MPKATRFTRRKSRSFKPADDDEDKANITFEEFRGMSVVPAFTRKGLGKNHKLTFRANDYARFWGVALKNRGNDIQPQEYWVGEIQQIRRSRTSPDFWIHVRWLWSPKEIKDLGVKDTSHMGEWERTFCSSAAHSETVVHSDTIEGPTEVLVFNEHAHSIPDNDTFYVRSTFNYTQKSLAYLDTTSECKCAECGLIYNPDDSLKSPLRYCATCRVWCHTSCGKAKGQRLVKSVEFSNPQHYAKGLMLSGPAGEPMRPGPKSKKARNVADLALNVDLSLVTKRIPNDVLTTLVALAEMRIVRPLPGNIAGNKSYVLRAREWIREARIASGWSQDRGEKLENWVGELIQEIGISDLLAPDNRKEAKSSALFVCSDCGYPV